MNESILEGYPIAINEMAIDEAKKLGAMALFGAKYGSVVRVVDMGGYSIELCGGTHLDNTAKAGAFRILSEFSVASGVRRIEAITGLETISFIQSIQKRLYNIAAALKVNNISDLEQKAAQDFRELHELQKQVEQFKSQAAAGEAKSFLLGAKDVGGLKVITTALNDVAADRLRQMGDVIREKEPAAVAVLASVTGEKLTFLAVCGKDAVSRGIKAGELIKQVTGICGGSGGGKPDSAMGGGKDLLKMDDALASVDDFVAGKLGL